MRWGRALAGGLLAEAMLIVVVVPGAFAGSDRDVERRDRRADRDLPRLWMCRGIESKFVLHGTMTGLAAMLIYLIPVLAGGVAQPWSTGWLMD